MTLFDEEWDKVQEALVRGGLRQVIEDLIDSHTSRLNLSDENRCILMQAYYDSAGGTITIVPGEDPGWFAVMYEGSVVCGGIERNGVLYAIVHLSGGGLVSVITGRGLIENDTGPVFRSVPEAKAYIQGRIEQ